MHSIGQNIPIAKESVSDAYHWEIESASEHVDENNTSALQP